MSDSTFISAGAGPAGVLDPLANRADQVMRQAGAADGESRKIDMSAREFEALLLTNWLQHAYESFGMVPGGEGEADLDSGGDQFQAIAMQSLGETISAEGGIGIANMIAGSLHRRQEARYEADPPNGQTPVDRGGEGNSSIHRGND